VGKVVFRIEQWAGVAQSLFKQFRETKLIAHPARHGPNKMPKAGRKGLNMGAQKPVELQHGFVVKNDSIQLGGLYSGGLQAVGNRIHGEAAVLLFPAKPLLARCGDDGTIPQ